MQADTIRVIFSFTDTDPEDITGLDYHGGDNRGAKSVLLLSHNDSNQTLPEDSISMDFLISEVKMKLLVLTLIQEKIVSFLNCAVIRRTHTHTHRGR